MSEHRIRLRGRWDCQYREGDLDDGLEIVRRIDLPIPSLDLAGRVRLTRQFGKPPVDARIEEVILEMSRVHGLISVCLNGQYLVGDQVHEGYWSSVLKEPLLPRNGLVLEVLCESIPSAVPFHGEISLLIRHR